MNNGVGDMHKLPAYTKTRIAPTPSGFLHLGNILSFAITAALARKTGAKILLRIDDLDRERANKPYIQDIFDTLIFLNIPWDEGPRNTNEFENGFSQLQRIELYNEALNQLADEKLVYACNCSRTQLAANTCGCQNKQIPLSTSDVSWRLITDARELLVKTLNDDAIVSALPAEMSNFIVKKKDGSPAYQLTSMVDDVFYSVDLIVRGQDLWPSTMAQLQLARVLGKSAFQDIAFFHHPLLMESSGKKLSKSAGATSIKFLRESGKSADDVYTLIASMLGINEKVDTWQQLREIAVSIS
jgi:glutamyl/glutaminyl-tRNA synthetase